MLIAILHLIGDQDDPYGIVSKLMAAVPAGSYLALSQVASDIEPEQMAEAAKRYNRLAHETQRHRSHAEVARFFDGLELSSRAWWPSSNGGPDPRSKPRPGQPCGEEQAASAEAASPSPAALPDH